MRCNGRNHRSDCHCGWGGRSDSRPKHPLLFATRPAREGRKVRLQRLTIPAARCPKCQERVFFHKAVGGGRVYLDRLGPPWPRHACMESPAWNMRRLGKNGGDDIVRPRTPAEIRRCAEQARGWRPVCEMQPGPGRPADSFVSALAGGTVWLDDEEAGMALLWFPATGFNWDGPVFARTRPKDPQIIEFETIRMIRGAPRPMRLTAILDDASSSGQQIAGRLARASG